MVCRVAGTMVPWYVVYAGGGLTVADRDQFGSQAAHSAHTGDINVWLMETLHRSRNKTLKLEID